MPPVTRQRSRELLTTFNEYIRTHLDADYDHLVQIREPGPLADINRINLLYKFADWRFGEVYACDDPDETDCPQNFIRRYDKARLRGEGSDDPMVERCLVTPFMYHGLPQYVKRMRDTANMFMVTKGVPVGCFNRLLPQNRNYQRISEDESKPYLHQLYNALEFIHNIGIIHRCVCLDHCLIFAHGQVKLFEFTCATVIGAAGGLIGHPKHRAPEMYDEFRRYGFAVDWWAFGVLVYRLFLGEYPFLGDNDDDLKTAVTTERPLNFPAPEMTGKLSDFIGKLLEKEPSDRLGFDVNNRSDAIRNHPWFKESLSGEWTSPNYKNPLFKMDVWKGTPVHGDIFKYFAPENEADAEIYKMF